MKRKGWGRNKYVAVVSLIKIFFAEYDAAPFALLHYYVFNSLSPHLSLDLDTTIIDSSEQESQLTSSVDGMNRVNRLYLGRLSIGKRKNS
ncbi:MAG TPA: hypothetical protein VJN71_07400 [Nitrososphaerales archaeon]|nr:hypothetical protein [Nitrososphaerales archaeon]